MENIEMGGGIGCDWLVNEPINVGDRYECEYN